MPELVDLATRIAAAAKPGEQVEAYVSWHRDTDIRVYEGAIESLASAESAGIGVRVIVDHRQGFAYVGSLEEKLGREALEEARDNASFATPDENLGLATPDAVAAATLELWDDGVAAFDGGAKIELALELERKVRSGDRRIRQVTSADYGDALSESAIASSAGISASSRRTTCYLGVDAVAGEGDETQTGDGYTVGRGPATLDLDKAVADAIERSTRLLGARKPESAHLDVILDRRVTATLLGILAGTLSGEEVAKGRSLFCGRLGEEVGTTSLTLVDDPTDGRAFGAGSYDAEGLACRRNVLIDKGQLSSFLYDTYSARLAGTSSTGSAVRGGFKSTPGVGARALTLVPGELDQAAMIASVGRGLLVQSISGVHSGVNTVSGDFSVGAQGLMIRDGALAEPVREFTIASTLQKMLQHVLAIGNDLEWLPSVAIGVSLAIGDLAMSGA